MENKKIEVSALPFNFNGLEDQYGNIAWAEAFCPGVYYIGTEGGKENPSGCAEYLVVTDDSPVISGEARSYGKRMPMIPTVYLYDYEYSCKGRHVVEYEAYKYLTEQGLPLPDDRVLGEIKSFGIEVCPEYFGEFSIPTETPWGLPLRHDRLWNGLFWLETKEIGWVLAIAYPLCSDLWNDTLELGVLNKYDRENGIENTFGYRFYTCESSCLPIYEMIDCEAETWGPKIDMAALQNAVRKFFPAYGTGDGRNGPKFESGEEIQLTQGVGTEFYHFL